MSVLTSEERRLLERTILQARNLAEQAADKALQMLAVEDREARSSMSPEERRLRVQLRAVRKRFGRADALTQACAYEQWHRMLFARFLAENSLLIHPEYRVPVTLEECAELGREKGESDRWVVASRFAAGMLPGIFRQDDPLLRVRFAVEDRIRLEELLEGLPPSIFTSDDGLGWTYQFWQSKRKTEIQRSGLPVEGPDIGAVTQLFTEHYMVQFLLQNTLGAWWLSLHPESPLKARWEYYKPEVQHDFSAWPKTVAEVRIIDPCCGSGHFLVEAFNMLLGMYAEEGLSSDRAVESILRNNLFGLEIDDRCVQIAAFALALSAWKAGFPTGADLPVPNVACSGLPLGEKEETWQGLANGDNDLAEALVALYTLFANAGDVGSLGSLLDPINETLRLPFADPGVVMEKLVEALKRERNVRDSVAETFGYFAKGVLRAFPILAGKYHLAVTNPPFLLRGKQGDVLKDFCAKRFPDAKKDLATCFIERCRAFTDIGGCYALVTPQNWLFLGSDKRLRERALKEQRWLAVARMGEHAFESSAAAGAFTALLAFLNRSPGDKSEFIGMDASDPQEPAEKAAVLRSSQVLRLNQYAQLRNPASKIVIGELRRASSLGLVAICCEGMHSGDYPRFGRRFWELQSVSNGWARQQGGPSATMPYGGREHVMLWEDGKGRLVDFVRERLGGQSLSMWIKGQEAWGRLGIAVSAMRDLHATLYAGDVFTHGVYAIIPRSPDDRPALWRFCQSEEFRISIRELDQKLCVARTSLEGVPFDLGHWQEVGAQEYPNGLPEPHSEDPTQWLFKGSIKGSEQPLHVAVGGLLGYRWPEQPEEDERSGFADPDGIVCLSPVMGERPAADRLRDLLAAAYGPQWSMGMEDTLLVQVGYKGKGLDAWLRDAFFDQHSKLFHNRPFIWHIWDGRKDGFSALVNYHSLDRAKLEKLIYSYLGDWIRRQKDDIAADKPGAESRLAAAQDLQKKLEAILVGEAPYDIYVRWKPIEQQPIRWEPDLSDGVRLNIRPFVQAGVLRSRVTINWNKDRGRDPDGFERINDIHLTLEQKRKAKERE